MSIADPSNSPDEPSGAPLVTVAVINYKGEEYLQELLGSLRQQTFRDFETLLIDNDSQDGSLDLAGREFPEVRLLPQEKNLGFAPAANLAARHSNSEFLALLNTDLRLDPVWLQELVGIALGEASIAAVASKLLLYHDPRRLNGVGGEMNRLGFTWDRGMFEEDRGQYDRSAQVFFASAGAALFRRNLFLQASAFDERFFMYHEDVDLCWRFWIMGYQVVTAPRAVAYHHFGGSTRKEQGMSWREGIGERNSLRSILKNVEAHQLPGILWELLRLPYGPRRKWRQLLAFLWNLIHLPETLRLRRSIQKRRRRRDRELRYLVVQLRDVPLRL